MPSKKEFEHESLQDAESVADYLETIINGIRAGKLTVSSGEGEVDLRPQGLIRFSVRASERPDRHRLALKLVWSPGQDSGAGQDPLRISTGG
ncbi:MAG: amphi-Trp domain-containing protein [Planctomycetes bacterium]|nr:amphi-Trp domain-containing protein [Planctomycetota bacterium]